jgi:small subunit ribosomal protein S2
VTNNIEDMVQQGVHFGHPTSRWNPKMAPYIYAKRKGVCIIDLIQTAQQLDHVSKKLTLYSSQGKRFLFVGTKPQASDLVSQMGIASQSFYVNQRWLGGLLTNWKTIKNSLYTLQKLQAQESSGAFLNLPKKEATTYRKNKERLQKYVGGLQGMRTLPDVVVILGQVEEMNAVLECQKLGITTVSILDTDCDPTLTNLFVVANDDSFNSLRVVCQAFLNAILLGREGSKGVKGKLGRLPFMLTKPAPKSLKSFQTLRENKPPSVLSGITPQLEVEVELRRPLRSRTRDSGELSVVQDVLTSNSDTELPVLKARPIHRGSNGARDKAGDLLSKTPGPTRAQSLTYPSQRKQGLDSKGVARSSRGGYRGQNTSSQIQSGSYTTSTSTSTSTLSASAQGGSDNKTNAQDVALKNITRPIHRGSSGAQDRKGADELLQKIGAATGAARAPASKGAAKNSRGGYRGQNTRSQIQSGSSLSASAQDGSDNKTEAPVQGRPRRVDSSGAQGRKGADGIFKSAAPGSARAPASKGAARSSRGGYRGQNTSSQIQSGSYTTSTSTSTSTLSASAQDGSDNKTRTEAPKERPRRPDSSGAQDRKGAGGVVKIATPGSARAPVSKGAVKNSRDDYRTQKDNTSSQIQSDSFN